MTVLKDSDLFYAVQEDVDDVRDSDMFWSMNTEEQKEMFHKIMNVVLNYFHIECPEVFPKYWKSTMTLDDINTWLARFWKKVLKRDEYEYFYAYYASHPLSKYSQTIYPREYDSCDESYLSDGEYNRMMKQDADEDEDNERNCKRLVKWYGRIETLFGAIADIYFEAFEG